MNEIIFADLFAAVVGAAAGILFASSFAQRHAIVVMVDEDCAADADDQHQCMVRYCCVIRVLKWTLVVEVLYGVAVAYAACVVVLEELEASKLARNTSAAVSAVAVELGYSVVTGGRFVGEKKGTLGTDGGEDFPLWSDHGGDVDENFPVLRYRGGDGVEGSLHWRARGDLETWKTAMLLDDGRLFPSEEFVAVVGAIVVVAGCCGSFPAL